MALWKKRVEDLESLTQVPTFLASAYQVVHRPVLFGALAPRLQWRMKCGWRFGGSEYSVKNGLPSSEKLICEGCSPGEEARATAAAVTGGASVAEAPSDEEIEM